MIANTQYTKDVIRLSYIKLMKTDLLVLSVAAVLAGSAPLRAEVREFHDVKGRVIKAELLKARGPNVVIRGADGKEATVPLKNFSRDDVTYICRWIAAEPAALDYRFDIRETEKTVEKVPGLGRPNNAYAYGTAEESQRAYDLSVSNRCQNPVEGVRLCYRVFLVDCVDVSETGGYASVLSSRKLLFKSGNVELPPMNYNASHKFTTRAHAVQKMKAANTYSGISERDRMRGVWVRCYRHGVQIAEWKSGTVPRCEWPENNAEKSALEEDKDEQKPLVAALSAPIAEPVKPVKPVKHAATPKLVEKPKEDGKSDLPEELKIFDMADIVDDKKDVPGKLPPLK